MSSSLAHARTQPGSANNVASFRKELLKIMPGYQWTVHKGGDSFLEATGIQSSGFNRLSTLRVTRRPSAYGLVEYEVKSAGYGTRAKWLHTNVDGTLARALRGLQDYYAAMAEKYRGHAASLETGRKATTASAVGIREADEPQTPPLSDRTGVEK